MNCFSAVAVSVMVLVGIYLIITRLIDDAPKGVQIPGKGFIYDDRNKRVR